MLACLDRPTPRDFVGTSFVMVEPAAINDSSPIDTGATMALLLPTKLFLPILVLYLFFPS